VQRYRCDCCLRTYSGLTGTQICGLHRHDLFWKSSGICCRIRLSRVASSHRVLDLRKIRYGGGV
jgi:transposase-like protein